MLRCYWIFAIGLCIAASGQAQEQTHHSEQNTQAEQSATDDEPFSVPVRIIEDEAHAEVRERYEQEARQREIDDLVAQEGMNAATRSIERATWHMRDYARYSTMATWIGTLLVFVTLLLMIKANGAAIRAAEAAERAVSETTRIGEAQVRAYPSIKAMAIASDKGSVVAEIVIVNSGQSPAFDCDVRIVGELRPIPKPPRGGHSKITVAGTPEGRRIVTGTEMCGWRPCGHIPTGAERKSGAFNVRFPATPKEGEGMMLAVEAHIRYRTVFRAEQDQPHFGIVTLPLDIHSSGGVFNVHFLTQKNVWGTLGE